MDLINTMTCVLAVVSAMGSSLTSAKLAEPDLVQQATSSGLATLVRKTRQSRCIRCYDDRYIDDGRNYNYGRNYYASSYGGASRSSYDDKSWYYPADRYETRGRYEDRYADRNYDRNDDRYYPRIYDRFDSRGYNDRYDWKSYPDFRGYGYDNQEKYNTRYNDGYNRDPYDRNRGTYEGRYVDRDYYERYPVYPQRGGYDHKNYRPWDESYRGTSGFDNSGRGYYFAGRPNEQPTAPIYRPPPQSSHGRPYLPNAQSSPRPLQPPNTPSSSSPTASSSSSGPPSGPHHYQYTNRPSRPDDDSKAYAGGWGYVNDRDKPNEYNDRNKDTESSSYGVRPRPLGGSYLHDRDSNTPTAVNPIGGQDGKEADSQKPLSALGSESNSASENKMN